jgi:hypothetical protein
MEDLDLLWGTQLLVENDEWITKTQLVGVNNFICYAATNRKSQLHFFIIEFSKGSELGKFLRYKFQGVQFNINESENFIELHIYLMDNDLMDLFCLFVNNILEIDDNIVVENDLLNGVENVIIKWKKLFDKVKFSGLSLEEQKGLMGELLFINDLLNKKVDADLIISSWQGPDMENKDFIFNSVGVEVKFTSVLTPRLKISSEHQLDLNTLDQLFLVQFRTEEVREHGQNLNELIEKIRNILNVNQAVLNRFNESLMRAGYFEDDIDKYLKRYNLLYKKIYKIIDDFPRISSSNLDNGVLKVSYSLEPTAIEKFTIEEMDFLNNI